MTRCHVKLVAYSQYVLGALGVIYFLFTVSPDGTLCVVNTPRKPYAKIISPFKPSVPLKGHLQTVQTQIRRHRTRRLIGVYTVCTNFRMSTKHDNNKNYADTPYTGYEPVKRVSVKESARRKWVNMLAQF